MSAGAQLKNQNPEPRTQNPDSRVKSQNPDPRSVAICGISTFLRALPPALGILVWFYDLLRLTSSLTHEGLF